MKDDRGDLDLTLLIENHQKELWDFKQKESQWIMDKNQLEGNQKIINELSAKLLDVTKANFSLKSKLVEAEEALANALASDERQKEADEKMMFKLERIRELENINDDHRQLNGHLQSRLTEVEQEVIELHADNKKLARQIQDLENNRKYSES
jgi:septal ring factor EnvC (AmiA/AmiB activator)|tara:strand:- start:863 stop:1318 length:456 start_codon:yes stop_codon:yes gene_type:complete